MRAMLEGMTQWDDPAAVAEASSGRLPARRGVATAAFLAMRMGRPLFLEGDPGVGKTALAQALAEITGAPLIRLQCYEGIDASQALYDWDFPRQMLHLRAAGDGAADADVEASLYDRRFLIARPILQALETAPSVLLVDEIDRADDEFEAFLLEVLADNAVTIPELGTIRATDAAADRPHVQPHPRGARRAQAPLPVPLGRAPGLRPRGRDRPARGARGVRATGPRRRRGRSAGCARPTCSSRRGSPRRSTGPARCTRWAPRGSTAESARRDPRRGDEVPRGRRPGRARAGPTCCRLTLMATAFRPSLRNLPADDALLASPGALRAGRGRGRPDRTRLAASADRAASGRRRGRRRTGPARRRCASEPDDLPRFDAVFDAWFRGRRPPPVPAAAPGSAPPTMRDARRRRPGDDGRADDEALSTAASDTEVLRHHDVTDLSADERDEVHRLIALLRPRIARRTRPRARPAAARRDRRRAAPSGTCSATAASPAPRPARRDGQAPPAGAAARRQRLDGAVRRRAAAFRARRGAGGAGDHRGLHGRHPAHPHHPAAAAARPGARAARGRRRRIPDWSGGTRLGEALRAFLDLWGQRGTARRRGGRASPPTAGNAATPPCSGSRWPGWRRLAHRVVWVNPHKRQGRLRAGDRRYGGGTAAPRRTASPATASTRCSNSRR